MTSPPQAGQTMALSAKAAKGIIDKTKNTVKIIDTRRFFIDTTKRRFENDGTKQGTTNNSNLVNYFNHWNDCIFSCRISNRFRSNCLATVQNVPLSVPPVMAAFLFSGNVEHLRVHLRKSTASNPGTEATDGNKAVILFHAKSSKVI